MRKLSKSDTGAGLGEYEGADGNGVEAKDGEDRGGDGIVHGFGECVIVAGSSVCSVETCILIFSFTFTVFGKKVS